MLDSVPKDSLLGFFPHHAKKGWTKMIPRFVLEAACSRMNAFFKKSFNFYCSQVLESWNLHKLKKFVCCSTAGHVLTLRHQLKLEPYMQDEVLGPASISVIFSTTSVKRCSDYRNFSRCEIMFTPTTGQCSPKWYPMIKMT